MKALQDVDNSPFLAAVLNCLNALSKKMKNPISFEVFLCNFQVCKCTPVFMMLACEITSSSAVADKPHAAGL